MIIYLSLLIGVVGLLMFALSGNPKIVRIGEILMFSGFLAFLLRVTEVVSLPH